MQGKTNTFHIKSLERRSSPKMVNGTSFLATNMSGKTMWLDRIFIQNIFTSMGISTKTPFVKLNGSLITYEQIDITEAMLTAANNEKGVEVTDRNGRPIFFKKVGLKAYSHAIHTLSASLQAQIDAVSVTFEDDWAAEQVPAAPATAKAAIVTPPPAAEIPPATEDDITNEATEEEGGIGGAEPVVNLDTEAGINA